MSKLRLLVERFRNDESGQGFVEYVMIIAIVALGLILALAVFRNHIGATFERTGNALENLPNDQYGS